MTDCAARQLEVYSHRALGGPSSPGVPDAVVSEKTIRVLHRAGIRSFDLDLFWSEDGHLFVGHPVALRQVWRHQLNESRSWKHSKSVFSLSAEEVRRAARSEAILEVPRLLEIARELRLSLALDLKGAARRTSSSPDSSACPRYSSHSNSVFSSSLCTFIWNPPSDAQYQPPSRRG